MAGSCHSHRWFNTRYRKTCLILLSYACVGYTDSILGVNMGQFEICLGESTSKTSKLASVSFAGFTFGNIILSLPFQRLGINLQVVYITCVLLLSTCCLLVPHIAYFFYPLFTIILLNGISGGIIQAASIARVLILWGNESAFFLQMLDFAYSVGSIIGPFVSQPFLIDVARNSTTDNSTLASYSKEDMKIVYPYSIIGVVSCMIFIVSLITCFEETIDDAHHSRERGNSLSGRDVIKHVSDSRSSMTGIKTLTMILLASLTYAFTNGMLNIESIFWTKYVTESKFKLSSSTGSSMLGVSWFVHVLSVALFGGVIKIIGIESSLFLGVTLILVSNALLVVSTTILHCYNAVILWAAVLAMSVGGSTFFGPLLAFMEKHFPVSVQFSSFYLIPNCIGNVAWPIIVGNFFDSVPDFVIYSMAFCAVVSTVLVSLVVLSARKMFNREASF